MVLFLCHLISPISLLEYCVLVWKCKYVHKQTLWIIFTRLTPFSVLGLAAQYCLFSFSEFT